MSIKLMYITNNPQVAQVVEAAGVDRIFVDMEYIGKTARQGGMDTVQSHHTVDDVKHIAEVLSASELLVRVNPIHEATADHPSSKEEIDAVIAAGAKILMLPYFKTAKEVKTFVELVGGRARTMPLIETPEAAACIDEILQIDGIDELFIGLNDLSLGYGMKFMFQLLADGTVERLIKKIKQRNIPYGFGGLASLDGGMLPGRMVLTEHYRLGSGCVILSRSFCNTTKITNLGEIETIFKTGISAIRDFESALDETTDFEGNRQETIKTIMKIAEG